MYNREMKKTEVCSLKKLKVDKLWQDRSTKKEDKSRLSMSRMRNRENGSTTEQSLFNCLSFD